MTAPLRLLLPALVALTAHGAAWGQATLGGGGIYTCIDAKGRRLTSDRPITECVDREQRELNPSGTVRRTVPPLLSAAERAAQEERERQQLLERQREADERRLNRVLVSRYPNSAAHDADRAKALQAVQDAITSGHRRIAELRDQRQKLQAETEFYKAQAQWPAKLRRQIEENEEQTAAQHRFILGQEEEKKRINARFDEELAKLKRLWAGAGTAAVTQ